MRTHHTLFRLSTALAIGGMTLGPSVQQAAWAQAAAPPAGAPAPTAETPPARVGRLASLSGTVSFHTADEDHWDPAALNYPVTSGDACWTEPQAAAAIDIGSTYIALSQQTEFDVDTLDNTALAATEPQGEVYLRIPMVATGETYTITTPRGAVAISAVGRIEIAAGDTDTPTTVTVVEGSAQVTGPNLSLSVGAHQTATITGTDTFQGSVGAETDDAFLTAQLQLEKQPPPLAAAAPAPSASVSATASASVSATATAYTPPAVVQEMTGAADLNQGNWSQNSQYGQVWYPPVQQDWVPYRDGHWAYVAPWGWTWVDNARWGFAPFHYGRWVQVNDRWGWTPGGAEQSAPVPGYYAGPVYAPALVTFLGVGAAVGFAAGLAASGGFGGNVGWAPLGYAQPYYPPYYVSRPYLEGMNRFYVPRAGLANITNNYTHIYVNHTVNTTVINNYNAQNFRRESLANQRGATFVPAAAMVRSEPIGQHVVRVTPQQLAEARPLVRPPVRPIAATLGASPAVLRRVNPVAAEAAARAPARPMAPGPAVRPMPARAPGRPEALARPPLVAHGAPVPGGAAPVRANEVRPGEVRPPAGAPGARPNGLPALAPAGRAEPNAAVHPGAPGPAIPQREERPAAAAARPPGAPETAAHPTPEARPPGAAAPHEAAKPETAPTPPRPAVEQHAVPPAAAHPAVPPEAHPAARPEARPAPRPEARPAAPPEARPAAPPEVHTAPRPEARPVAPPQVHPAPRPEARPAAPPEARPAPRPEARPAPRPEARPAAPPEARPAPRPEPRPAPRPEARPAPPPPPRPEPHPAPPPPKKCPAGHPTC